MHTTQATVANCGNCPFVLAFKHLNHTQLSLQAARPLPPPVHQALLLPRAMTLPTMAACMVFGRDLITG